MMILGACLVAIPLVIGVNDMIDARNRRAYAARINEIKMNANREELERFGIYI